MTRVGVKILQKCSELDIYTLDHKEYCLFLPLPSFSNFSAMASDYQFWKMLANPRKMSILTKCLFIVLWNVRMTLIKWVIILEIGKMLLQLTSKTLLMCYVAIMAKMCHAKICHVFLMKKISLHMKALPKNLTPLGRLFQSNLLKGKLLNKLIITLVKQSPSQFSCSM